MKFKHEISSQQDNFALELATSGDANKSYETAFRISEYTENELLLQINNRGVQERVSHYRVFYNSSTALNEDRIIEEISAIGYADVREMFDRDGSLLDISNIPQHISRAIKKIVFGKDGQVLSVDFYDKHKALAHLLHLSQQREIETDSLRNNSIQVNILGKSDD